MGSILGLAEMQVPVTPYIPVVQPASDWSHNTYVTLYLLSPLIAVSLPAAREFCRLIQAAQTPLPEHVRTLCPPAAGTGCHVHNIAYYKGGASLCSVGDPLCLMHVS